MPLKEKAFSPGLPELWCRGLRPEETRGLSEFGSVYGQPNGRHRNAKPPALVKAVHDFPRFVAIQLTFDVIVIAHTITVVCWFTNLIPPMILVINRIG